MKVFSFSNLNSADLIVDAVYEGGNKGNTSDDPISRILQGCGNMGGFRHAGRGNKKKYVVLYTSGEDNDWPDVIDINRGMFIYYGDNKIPGHELHDTPKKGNLILRNVFEWLHSLPHLRHLIPPFFIFQKFPTLKSARSVQFKGLTVPGFPGLTGTEDLVAVWKTTNRQRFQNYRATFTILDVPIISREWINNLTIEKKDEKGSPAAWDIWRNTGKYTPLTSEPTTVIRTAEIQSPCNQQQKKILSTVFEYFTSAPKRFEAFAAKIFQMHDSRVIIDKITRSAVDGGRDAIGRYLLGLSDDPVYVEFFLEAKCYQPSIGGKKANTIGVKEVARLISRIRNRQFGVLVTTSVVGKQAYEEVRQDQHPIIFISGKDIVNILVNKGFNTPEIVMQMLENEFPI